jgi:hypothetical protein
MIQQFLHVGCGSKTALATPFAGQSWKEVRFDINPDAKPDLIGTMTNMDAVESGSMDALYSSHNIEHLYPYEVEIALKEFRRVLKDDGFAVITCPDLRSVCTLIANDLLVEPAYMSPSGAISPIDILYGHRPALQAGNHYMAHRCGFTERVLVGTLQQTGFVQVASFTRPECFDIWALATCREWSEAELSEKAQLFLPVPKGNGSLEA